MTGPAPSAASPVEAGPAARSPHPHHPFRTEESQP
ncbi:hypothetical protein SGL43_04467 [Streptomyces globisporus]|uniref:Uncharacterized protein n=1 Tax=Streptomyces globisporus TaxID=1908 RepID=A0ABN8V9D3_STRGL|nr:hypothetical protein DER30_5819 [Streptomyces sp. HB202]CAH9417421.1 hypothetical protein SGL43_04467 [Streptomyces globisporus]